MTGNRKIMTIVFFIASVLFLPMQEALSEMGRKPDFVVGYAAKNLVDIDVKDFIVAMKIYGNELSKQNGNRYNVDNYLYNSLDDVVRRLRNSSLDCVGLSSLDYLRIKDKVDTELALRDMKGGKETLKFLLLTHQNRGYAALGDLKNRKLALRKEDEIAALFLNTLLLKQKYGEMKSHFASIEEKNKFSQVILSVFFGQADACLTTDVALKTMVEMNPQVGRDLKVMASSPEFTTFVTVLRRGLEEDTRQAALTVARALKSSSRGRQVLLLFKIEDLVPVKEHDLVSIKDLVEEYEQLRGTR